MSDDLWFYMSFCDADLPEGQQFLGGIYVRGASLEEALTRSHLLSINPGGEVECVGPFPEGMLDEDGVPEGDRERLLTRAEVEST